MIQTRKVQYQCMSKLSPRELASRAHQFLAESEKRSASNKKSYTVSSSTGMCCYHYTKVIVVRPCVRTDGSSPEASQPRRKKLCVFAKLKCGAASRGLQTRPATELALD